MDTQFSMSLCRLPSLALIIVLGIFVGNYESYGVTVCVWLTCAQCCQLTI